MPNITVPAAATGLPISSLRIPDAKAATILPEYGIASALARRPNVGLDMGDAQIGRNPAGLLIAVFTQGGVTYSAPIAVLQEVVARAGGTNG